MTAHDMNHRPATHAGGFTLIEVLVVIAIIGILLSLLLPALSASREKSRGTQCLTRLRSLAHGWHMYADDHDDVAVPGRMHNAGGGTGNPANYYDVGNGEKYRPRWAATMGKYVGLFAFNPPVPDADRQDYDSNAYQCPTVPDRMDSRNHAYGYNYQFLGNARKEGDVFRNFPVNRSRITSFGSTVMAADCLGTAAGFAPPDRKPYSNEGVGFDELGNHGWTLDPPRLLPESDHGSGDAGSPRTTVDERHLSKANAIFCDGHASPVTAKFLGYRLNEAGVFVDGGAAGPGQPTNSWFSGTSRDSDPPISTPP
ncbi:MAG TPA: prepilin-type N-terminal cleavage/methylation domain-containing protein [Phycisphaerae bacterium]|nr:prepilin-type N-terminal cleavage/methylation domain-containing protein [Phycisphaerae bacterium]